MRIRVVAATVLTASVTLVGATGAFAAVNLTSAQLADGGFPKTPNVTAWDGTARISTNAAPVGAPVTVTGIVGKDTKVGQVLTWKRYVPKDAKGDGEMRSLNITTTVNANHTYSITAHLGQVGTYGYSIGYSTSSFSPEFVGMQFQVTTTAK
jgi:hypothetical protein